jgi:endonuclease/exonuclease/phosphatase family metal-dependent hydrolase
MPYYKGLFDTYPRDVDSPAKRRAAAGLLSLRRRLRKEIPPRTVEETLLLATWNIREFGRNKMFGPRLDESIQYIAEIINHFDLVAVQEVKDNLGDLKKLIKVLGDWWEYIVTDVVAGSAGNTERIAYLYDTRKVRFDHVAGEVTLPEEKGKYWQLARTPFICTFRTGWRRFALVSVHIYYGESKPLDERRLKEIEKLSAFLADKNTRRQKDDNGEPESIILLGDFNIFDTKDKTFQALENNDFTVPIVGKTNLGDDKYFDQIAFHDPRNLLWPKKRDLPIKNVPRTGVFRFLECVFRDKDLESYDADMLETCPDKYPKNENKEKFYRNWRTFQMSDHCPLWVELRIDFSDPFIAVAGGLARRAAATAKAETKTVKPAKKKPSSAKAGKKTTKKTTKKTSKK